jgi:hypothetical protein
MVKKNVKKNNNVTINPSNNDLRNPIELYNLCHKYNGPNSIFDILKNGEWVQSTLNKHNKWIRLSLVIKNGVIQPFTQTIVFSSTPGTQSAWKEQRSNLLNDQYHFYTSKASGNYEIVAIVKKIWLIKNNYIKG